MTEKTLRRWFRSLCVFTVILLVSTVVSAQTTTGTITGKVVDKDMLALPGVTITVESPALQGVMTVVSTENGDYIVPQLPPGTYKIKFPLSGFAPQTQTG